MNAPSEQPEFEIEPRETALLVIDMQVGFCSPGGSVERGGVDITPCREVIPHVRALVESCRAAGIPDFWTLQHHYAEDATRARHRIPHHTTRGVAPPCLNDSEDAEVVPELADLLPVARTRQVYKHRFGSFHDTRLETLLRMHDTRMLIICGVTTSLCVETTCREAYMRDYDVVVAGDAVATYTRSFHEASLRLIGTFIGAVLSTRDVLRRLSVPPPSTRPSSP